MPFTRRGKRRLAILAAVGLACALAFVLANRIWTMQQQRLLAQARAQAMAAYARGDLEQTLFHFSYYFERKKDDLEANLVFAEARARQPVPGGRHLGEAIDLYDTHGLKLIEATESLPDRERRRQEILERLLELYAQLGLQLELGQTVDRLLAIDPDHASALSAKAELMVMERRFDEAHELAQRLIALEPQSLRWRRLQLQLMRQRGMSVDDVIEQCARWAGESDADGRYHLLAANALLEADHAHDAMIELDRAIQLGADAADVLEELIATLDELDLRDRGDQLIASTAARHPGQPWVREIALARLWRSNRVDDALAELASIELELPLLTPTLLRYKTLILLSAHRIDEATAVIGRLAGGSSADKLNDRDRAWAAALAAVLQPERADWPQTEAALRTAIALAPDDPVLHYLLGEAYERLGEPALAMQALAQAHALDPHWLAAGMAYGEALLDAGRIDEAFKVARAVFSRGPKDRLPPFLLYARAYLAARESQVSGSLAVMNPANDRDLLETLEQAHRDVPANPAVMLTLADAYLLFGRPEDARQFMRAALAAPGATADLALAFAELSRRRGLNEEQALIQQAERLDSRSVAVAFAKAMLLAESGDYILGLSHLDRAVRAAIDNEALLQQASAARCAYLLDINHPGANDSLRKLVNRWPQSAEIQRFVLAQPAVWEDLPLAQQAAQNLKRLLGESSPQVRLAEATLLLNGNPDEAALAKAIMQINAVLERFPESLAGLSLMADALTRGEGRNVSSAIDYLERAVNFHPAEAELIVRLVALLQQFGDYDKAGRYLRRLSQLSQVNPELRRAELHLLQSQGDFEAALARASALVNESSQATEQLVLASLYQRTGRLEEAEEIYDRLLSQPYPEPLIKTQAADFFAYTGRFKRGLDLLRAVETPGGPARHGVLLGAFHQRHGRVVEAGQWLRRAVELDPQSVEARHELARHCLSVQERQEAREHALAGLRLQPDHAGLRVVLAIASLNADAADRKQAITALRELGAEDDDLLAVLSLLDQIPVVDGLPSPTEANFEACRRLVEAHGGFLASWQLAISLHLDAGRTNEAIALARRAVSRLPAAIEPAQWAAQLLYDAGRWHEALAEAQEWRRRSAADPTDADVMIAFILLELRQPAAAIAQIEPYADRFLAERRESPHRVTAWLRALAATDRYDRVAAITAPLVREDRRWRDVLLDIAPLLGDAHAFDALSRVESAAADPLEWLALAQHWIALGRRSASQECFRHAIGLAERAAAATPSLQVRSLIVQGAVAEAQQELSLAESLYRRALELEPQNALAMNNMAFVLSRSPERCADALAYIERAIELQGDDPEFLDTQAMVLLCLGRVEEAGQVIARARSQEPDHIGIAITMIEAQLAQGLVDEAAIALNRLEQRLRPSIWSDPLHQARLELLRHRILESRASAES